MIKQMEEQRHTQGGESFLLSIFDYLSSLTFQI